MENVERARLAARALVARYARRLAEDELERERVMRLLPDLARALAARYGVGRVIAFGSLVWSHFRRDGSDVDLAVEGLPPKRFFEVWSFAARFLGRTVDLVALEDAPAELRERIMGQGRAFGGSE